MSDQQHSVPEEEAGGYGTPTSEQESAGVDKKQFAQPRDEEDFDAAGLNQNSPDGEIYETGSPNLSHFGGEDADSSGEPGAGTFGGTDDQRLSENESEDAGFEAPAQEAEFGAEDDVDVPSADAELDENNTGTTEPGAAVPETQD